MPSVTVEGVSVRLGERLVLKGADLRVDGPKVITILGPSGAGKTTLLHVIGGLIAPESGNVVSDLDGGRYPSWIVQNSPLLPRRSAQENVAIGAVALGVDWYEAQRMAAPVMVDLGIHALRTRLGYRLSGGERQRVAVGRAITAGSRLILADEPTASLDAEARDRVWDALRRASDAGCLVLITTHDPVIAARSDAVFALVDGRIEDRTIDAARRHADAS